MDFKRISVIGLGYIGLPTAAVFASRGIEVVGVDVNQKAVDTINRGEIHIVEPDLDIVVKSVVSMGKLRATTQPEAADAFLIAVPTPFIFNKEQGEDHEPDLSYIEKAANAIAPVLEKGKARRDVWLPAGAWTDWRTGATFAGSQTVTVDAAYVDGRLGERPVPAAGAAELTGAGAEAASGAGGCISWNPAGKVAAVWRPRMVES